MHSKFFLQVVAFCSEPVFRLSVTLMYAQAIATVSPLLFLEPCFEPSGTTLIVEHDNILNGYEYSASYTLILDAREIQVHAT